MHDYCPASEEVLRADRQCVEIWLKKNVLVKFWDLVECMFDEQNQRYQSETAELFESSGLRENKTAQEVYELLGSGEVSGMGEQMDEPG